MDAIALLKADHRTVEKLFKQFEKLGEGADAAKKKLVAEIIRELSMHASIEEQVFYPAVRNAVEDADDMVLEALEEHHIVKWTLSELAGLSPSDERFDAKVTVLMESVRHHVKEEESDLFPDVRKQLDRKTLIALGSALEAAKKVAPTKPHPRAPDTPPGNKLVGLGAGLLDRAKELVENVTHPNGSPRASKGRGKGAASRLS